MRIRVVIFAALPMFFISGVFAANLNKCVSVFGEMNPDIPRFGGWGPFSPIQAMANALLAYAPRKSAEIYQVAVPVNLKFNPRQPEQFGDGQKNALATFGSLPSAPFTAVLKRAQKPADLSILTLIFSSAMPGFDKVTEVEFSTEGKGRRIAMDNGGAVALTVDLKLLKWDTMFSTRPVFFRPVGWNDWFAVQFPYPYLRIGELLAGMDPSFRHLPDGRSVIDPLGLKGSKAVQENLRRLSASNTADFPLARAERVHGSYLDSDGSTTLTSSGGVWTRYRIGSPFKIVYLAKDPRNFDAENREGVVSGTGPHYIGATAEVIVHSVGAEPLMTFYGVTAPSSGPNNGRLAWGFSHQWVGTWLKPDEAFITPQGQYHWHLNHLSEGVAAEVFTPPEVPGEKNFQGFPKAN